ncbi:MAG: hypothetical protein ACREXS_15165 [Gammaproteobacteria bacterium]
MASYGDLFYLYQNTTLDANYDPFGKWIGSDLVGDDQPLVGNVSITFDGDLRQENFEGTAEKSQVRPYWCAHDDAS